VKENDISFSWYFGQILFKAVQGFLKNINSFDIVLKRTSLVEGVISITPNFLYF